MSDESFEELEDFDEIKRELINENNDFKDSIPKAIRSLRFFGVSLSYVFWIAYQLIFVGFVFALEYFLPQFFTGTFFIFGENLVLNFLFWVLLIAVFAPLVMRYFLSPPLKKFSPRKKICFHLSVSAAEEIESGDLVKGSFLAMKLFDKMEGFSEKERLEIGYFKSNLKTLFQGYIEKLHKHRDAVGQAVLESGIPSIFFANHLYNLAHSLFSFQNKPNYSEGMKSLRFFFRRSEKYFKKETFLEKHKNVSLATKILAEAGKLVLVPILSFILWYFFKYSG